MKWLIIFMVLASTFYLLYVALDRGYTNEYQRVSDDGLKEFNEIRLFMEKIECPDAVDGDFIESLAKQNPNFDFLEKQGGVIVNGHFFLCMNADKKSTFKFVSPEEAP